MAQENRQTELDVLHERQERALREGIEAYRKGQPVIFLHGRPYRDPGHLYSEDEEDGASRKAP